MANEDGVRSWTDGWLMSAGLLLIAGAVCLGVATKAYAMDWTEVNPGNVGDWTGDTDESVGVVNFFNVNSSSGNTLTVQDANQAGGPTQITGAIFGGYANPSNINETAMAIDNNSVTVLAPTQGATSAISGNVSVYGGVKWSSGSGDTSPTVSVSNNTVTIHSGVNLGTGAVIGAGLLHTNNNLTQMSGNEVIIYGGTMSRIAGAAADTQAASLTAIDSNSVTIDLTGGGDLNVSGTIYGADFQGGSVTNNTVTFTANDSSTFSGMSSIFGGRSGRTQGTASNNTVIIDLSARTTASNAFGTVRGGSSGNNTEPGTVYMANTAYDNEVYIYGSTAANVTVGEVVGGRTFNGIAERNHVYLTDVTLSSGAAVMGGYTVIGNTPPQNAGQANDNTVTILRGTMNGDIYGGRNDTPDGGSANGNVVDITDATIASDYVYGGFSVDSAANNAVNITGYGTSFSGTTLAGGNQGLDGNVLTTTTAINLQVQTITNFESYVYNMTANEMDKTVYNATAAVDFANTNHTLNFDATQGPPLQEGQVLTLINNTTNGNTLTDDKFVKNIKDGFLYNYDSFFGMDGNSLVFEILGRQEDERNITFGQSQLAGMNMVNAASDLARSIHNLYDIQCKPGCPDDTSCTPCPDPIAGGPVIFAGAQGGAFNSTTGGGSRLDLNSVSALTGAGWRRGNVLLAGFFEIGHGKYDTKLHGIKIVDGDKSDYFGVGVLARYERGGFYGETGFHIGRVNTDFESTRFGTATDPVHVQYKTKSTYAGIDALMGYKLNAGCSTFDFMGRYSWNHVGGDKFTAHDARFDQGTVNSHRLRTGVEWSYSKNAIHPYVGAFYEYEAGAKSKHTVWGERLRPASQKGSSGVGRIGVRFGGGDRRLSTDIGVEGYVGKRRGVIGRALVGYSF